MLSALFVDPGFMPHVHCYLAQRSLIWTMVTTDVLIGVAYIAISLTLGSILRKVQVPFNLVIVCFGLFIAACGATHFMEVWTLWNPDYWLAATIKSLTAIASLGTAVYLFRLKEMIVGFAELAKLSDQRKFDLELSAKEMEKRVLERTQELKALGSRLTRISSATDLGTWYCDLPFGKLNWSKITKEHFWLPEEVEVTIDTFYERIHPEDRERTQSTIAQAIESHKTFDIEYRTIDPSTPETYKWIRALGWTTYDDSGTPLSFDGITLDLTEKKKKEDEKERLQTEKLKANEQLKEIENRYATLTQAIPQLVWTCLADGRCNYLSQQWENYTGVSTSQQMNLAWLDRVIHPEDRERTLSHWMGAVSEKHPYDIEYRIRRFDGEYRWFQTRGTPMRDGSGKILYWVGTCTDIQNQKLLAAELQEAKLSAERANEAKTQFLANMSHEIRTPIGAITGFVEMLNQSGHSESDRQNFTMVIERNSKHLLRLIDDILDLSKVEAGKLVFENSEFSLVEFITEFASLMSLKAAEKGIQFVLNAKTLIPQRVYGDQLRLKQILTNVTGNAIKFTSKGVVIVDVSYTAKTLEFVVKDTGIGISKDNIGNLFRPFSQADPSLTRKYGGTGLGLILSKRLANQFGGDLILQSSELGKGSRFAVTVCIEHRQNSMLVELNTHKAVEHSDSSTGQVGAVLAGIAILLVEDSPDNRALISIYLRKSGAKLFTANDGLEGYQEALKILPDIVLMDIQMPKMDGHEATRKLRADGFSKPIIALTAHAMREERDRCVESGFSDYLTKPLQRERLIELIATHTSKIKV